MPKPMFQKVGKDAVEKEIQAIVGDDNFAELKKDEPQFLQDFCSLGVLMTDADRCYEALTVLNSLLWKKNYREQFPVGFKESKKHSPVLTKVNDGEVKHHGLLSGFFKVWEATYGFNAAQSLDVVQGSPKIPANTVPTLTRFVNPATFRTHLFKPGYHWKDPGVGTSHGEFTHRIQWYIVIQINLWEPFLNNQDTIKIFRMFADDRCRGVGNNADKTVWDAIFDRLYPGKEDFRTPETMHAWFKEPAQQKDVKVGVLSQLIAGRSLKREHQNEEQVDKVERKAVAGQIEVLAANDRPAKMKPEDQFKPGIVWYQPSELHPNSKVIWNDRDLILKR